jgi:hypothetical protein
LKDELSTELAMGSSKTHVYLIGLFLDGNGWHCLKAILRETETETEIKFVVFKGESAANVSWASWVLFEILSRHKGTKEGSDRENWVNDPHAIFDDLFLV